MARTAQYNTLRRKYLITGLKTNLVLYLYLYIPIAAGKTTREHRFKGRGGGGGGGRVISASRSQLVSDASLTCLKDALETPCKQRRGMSGRVRRFQIRSEHGVVASLRPDRVQ